MWWAMKTFAGLIGILMLTGTLRAGADEKLTLTVSPAVAFAPATLVVRAHIGSDSRNRAVEIVAESPEFYRSSEVQLDGDNAPVTNTFEFRSLPSGTYEIKATLIDSGGQPRASARSSVNIIASGGDHRR
jgi:hypothetical protein